MCGGRLFVFNAARALPALPFRRDNFRLMSSPYSENMTKKGEREGLAKIRPSRTYPLEEFRV